MHAHAALDIATPKDGATVSGTPSEISGTYVQDLAEGSSLRLRDAAGNLIAEGIIDPDDNRRMFIAEIPDLAPGEYTVRSTTISAEDGETDRATWTFTVEAAPTPEPTPDRRPRRSRPTPRHRRRARHRPQPERLGNAGADAERRSRWGPTGSAGDILLPIVAAAALLAVGAIWFTRRSRPTPGP